MMVVNSERLVPSTAYGFGDILVDKNNFRVFRSGQLRPIEPRAFEVLIFLIENRGRVIQKEEFFEQIWKQAFVSDSALTQEIKNIRKAIGDDANSPRFIETVRKYGYRFIGQVERAPSTPAVQGRKSKRGRMVVLPFVNLDGDPEQEFLSDGFTTELITELAALAPAELLVISRTTAMHYKRSEKPVAQICSELDVDYLIEGSMRREDGHIATTLQLIQGNDQMHLLSHRYECDAQDLFRMRNRMAKAVARAIGITPAADGTRRPGGKKPTTDPLAYTLYLKARSLDKTPEEFAEARECYEEAISRDPNFALAYDGLAELYWYQGFMGVAPAKDMQTPGMFYASKALELDPTLGETHALLAMYRKELSYDWGEVKREMDIARELDPESPVVRLRYAIYWLMEECLLDEAVKEMELALESDPQSAWIRVWYTCMLWFNRQYDLAIESAEIMVKLDPLDYMGYWMLGMVYREQGKYEEAISNLRIAVERSGNSPVVLGWLGLAFGQAGKEAEARAIIDHLNEVAKTTWVLPSSFGWTYFGLGELDEAFVWLDRAVDVRDHMLVPIKSYPFFDSIRDDPRYLALLRKMNYDTEGPGTVYGRENGLH